MRPWLHRACVVSMAALVAASQAADQPVELINMNNPGLSWRAHRAPNYTCVLTGTAVSEMRDDAFEVQFRHSIRQKLELYVIIPRLPKGGTVFMEAPTTRDRWRIFTESYVPALKGEPADTLKRNVAAGIPLHFTFEYGQRKRVKYETVPTGAVTAASSFKSCVDEIAQEALKAVKK